MEFDFMILRTNGVKVNYFFVCKRKLTGMLSEGDFDEGLGYTYLTETGRKTFVREFDEKLQTTVKHRRLGRNVSYRTFLRLECYKIIRHLLEIEQYKGLKAWW